MVPRGIVPALTLAVVVGMLACASPAAAWFERGFVWRGWRQPVWSMIPPAPPYRYVYPPGFSLSYSDPSGTTYCLSEHAGLYYACGYSPPAPHPAETLSPMPPPPAPPVGYREAPPPSGVLLFQLPPDAEATLDGVPVGLSRGLGIAAVPPGEHRLVLQVSGVKASHRITVAPHVILLVTPSGVLRQS